MHAVKIVHYQHGSLKIDKLSTFEDITYVNIFSFCCKMYFITVYIVFVLVTCVYLQILFLYLRLTSKKGTYHPLKVSPLEFKVEHFVESEADKRLGEHRFQLLGGVELFQESILSHGS